MERGRLVRANSIQPEHADEASALLHELALRSCAITRSRTGQVEEGVGCPLRALKDGKDKFARMKAGSGADKLLKQLSPAPERLFTGLKPGVNETLDRKCEISGLVCRNVSPYMG